VNVVHERPPKPTPSSTVPFRRDDEFVPRDGLEDVRRTCARPAGCAALFGLGGVGKSQIAIEYAYQVRDESPSTWVFWVHAGTQARFEQGYRRIAEATKIDGWKDPKADVLRLVRSWLCDESNGRWLMVVDNADDVSVFFQSGPDTTRAEPLFDFMPQTPNGSILVTSRNRDAAYRLTGNHASIFEVKPMNKDDALSLLRKKIGPVVGEDEAVQLIDALESMPLALTQAAAFIKNRAPRMTLSKYIDEVHKSDRERTRLLKKDVGDGRRDAQAKNSIIVTWQISFEYIRERIPTATRLLALMSLFNRQGIPEWLLKKWYGVDKEDGTNFDDDDDADFDTDIQTLIDFSLVKMGANKRDYEMHRLVQFSTKKWLELKNEMERWKKAYAILMNENYPHTKYRNWLRRQALFPHAEAVLDSQPKEAEALKAWASVLYKAAMQARQMRQYSKSYEMDFAALRTRRNVLGAEHLDTLNSLNSLGEDLLSQGKYGEAEAMHKQALQLRKRVLGVDHPDTLVSMDNLASTYKSQGCWTDAEALQLQVVETRKRKLGVDHHATLNSMDHLSETYRYLGRWKDAEILDIQATEIRKRTFGVDHYSTLISLSNLAVTYMGQGRLADAEAIGMTNLEMCKRKLGENNHITLISMHNLAFIRKSQGFTPKAVSLMQDGCMLRETVLGPYTNTLRELLTSWELEVPEPRQAESRPGVG
jgi:hypothetical protein